MTFFPYLPFGGGFTILGMCRRWKGFGPGEVAPLFIRCLSTD